MKMRQGSLRKEHSGTGKHGKGGKGGKDGDGADSGTAKDGKGGKDEEAVDSGTGKDGKGGKGGKDGAGADSGSEKDGKGGKGGKDGEGADSGTGKDGKGGKGSKDGERADSGTGKDEKGGKGGKDGEGADSGIGKDGKGGKDGAGADSGSEKDGKGGKGGKDGEGPDSGIGMDGKGGKGGKDGEGADSGTGKDGKGGKGGKDGEGADSGIGKDGKGGKDGAGADSGSEKDGKGGKGSKDGERADSGTGKDEKGGKGGKDGEGADSGTRKDGKGGKGGKDGEGIDSGAGFGTGKGGDGTDGEGKDGKGRDGKGGKDGGGVGSGAGRDGAGGAGGKGGPGGAGGPGGGKLKGETPEERLKRLAAEEEERRRRAAAEKDKNKKGGRGGGLGEDEERQRDEAFQILLKELKAKGVEILNSQPNTSLSHEEASNQLSDKNRMEVDKTVKESGDTDRLAKKLEMKLANLVDKKTPPDMRDAMQGVVIESARKLAENFVSQNYKSNVKNALISEMQRKGNETIIEHNGKAETFFFAAQRLKKAKDLKTDKPNTKLAARLKEKLEEVGRCRKMPRKLIGSMKGQSQETADYLSNLVTKPDEKIEAYVVLLEEMEAAGDAPLIAGEIQKTQKEAADYLRQITITLDKIKKMDGASQSAIQSKLKDLMAKVEPDGYTKSDMDSAISDSSRFLAAYVMEQAEKTKALKELTKQMSNAGDNILLRHGNLRKSHSDGADRLRGKTADQLKVPNADPVAAKKIQIKLRSLMEDSTPDNLKTVMPDVIQDATNYLTVHLLEPHVRQVCKCMKNVFVQCELWCDETLRHVVKPCCKCSRHVSAQALSDLAPLHGVHISPGNSRLFAPGLEISLTPCPSRTHKSRPNDKPPPCLASHPHPSCNDPTTSFMLYSTSFSLGARSTLVPTLPTTEATTETIFQTVEQPHDSNVTMLMSDCPTTQSSKSGKTSSQTYYTANQTIEPPEPDNQSSPFSQAPTTMYSKIFVNPDPRPTRPLMKPINTPKMMPKAVPKPESSTSSASIISTDQMSDWHAMMVSLMWNVQAWRDWIQVSVNRALIFEPDPSISEAEADSNWRIFQRRIEKEAVQWRQYNVFSRQLTLRLAQRYRHKQIVSPTRATVKTMLYMEYQGEMLEIIHMFNKWTQWLNTVVKEANSIEANYDDLVPLHVKRWYHFKSKVQEHHEDWVKYNLHLKIYWEDKYKSIISESVPSWKQSGPVWVVSAYGAVPSGAVAAGMHDGELTWLARTTHRCNVLPAALHPSKHLCIVYADGGTHHYTKYQVMCNAEVSWVAWRAGKMGARAVRVAAGVHAGRVLYRGSHLIGAVHAPRYRCHVIIFGRPFAFNCYELLVLNSNA